MTTVITTVSEWQALRKSSSFAERSIGFVPTMGALHEGHGSLLKRSRAENDLSILSIFVNPTQFNDPEDLQAYPQTPEGDLQLAREMGVDVVFMPRAAELYAEGYHYKVTEDQLSGKLCGAFRPGHFDGVLTVVLKLLLLVQPNRTYFGEKDYQQYLVVRKMAEAFFLDVEIIPCPIIREADGLAMSSRNARLTTAERELASIFFRTLQLGNDCKEVRKNLEAHGFIVDYIEEMAGRRYGAVRVGKVRLIDNVPL